MALGGFCELPVRDLTERFLGLRRQEQSRAKSAEDQADLYSDIHRIRDYVGGETKSEVGGGAHLLSGQPRSEFYIEHGKDVLPPGWVTHFDDLQESVEALHKMMMELKVLQAQRAKVKFDDTEDARLDRTMEGLVREITDVRLQKYQKMRKCEREVQGISDFQEGGGTKLDDKIRKNIQISFANRLRELAVELRKCERQQMKRMEKYGGELGKEEDTSEISLEEEDVQELDMMNEEARMRGVEIANLVRSVNELAAIYKELSVLVITQGTIIDRIDYNMESAVKEVDTGLIHMKKAEKIQRSTRAVSCLICLISMIMVLAVLFILKHS